MVIDLKDYFFSILLAAEDREAFAFTMPPLNNQEPAARYQWKVLLQGMACSPTICQLVVGRFIAPVRCQMTDCKILHYMDDLLLAAPNEARLQDLGNKVSTALSSAGFVITAEKIQQGPGIEFLGYRLGPTTIVPQGLHIMPTIATLWDVQKLVGTLQWVRNALGIPPRLMKPFYDQLKGRDPKEPRSWTPEMDSAWQEILRTATDNNLARWDSALPLEGAVTCCQQGAAVVIGHTLGAKPRPLCWQFSAQPARAFLPWLDLLACLLQKMRLVAVRVFGVDLDVVYLPTVFRDVQPLPDGILLALLGYGGQLVYSDSLPIFELAVPLHISLKIRVLSAPLEGLTVFTDASAATSQGVAVWRDNDGCWQKRVIHDSTVSVQVLEAWAVAMALLVWPHGHVMWSLILLLLQNFYYE